MIPQALDIFSICYDQLRRPLGELVCVQTSLSPDTHESANAVARERWHHAERAVTGGGCGGAKADPCGFHGFEHMLKSEGGFCI